MSEFDVGNLTVRIKVDVDADIDTLVQNIEKKLRDCVDYGEGKRVLPCLCGGAPLTHMTPRIQGSPALFHVECGSCRWCLRYGNTIIEFSSEEAAVNAWNAALSGSLLNG